jgi:hypothetical protein
MKILLSDSGQYYLVDTSTLKPKTLREVLLDTADGQLVTVSLDTMKPVDLGTLLEEALRAHTTPIPPEEKPSSSRSTGTPGKGGSGLSAETLKEIRDWARKNGHPDLKNTGRLSQEIIKEYDAANGTTYAK